MRPGADRESPSGPSWRRLLLWSAGLGAFLAVAVWLGSSFFLAWRLTSRQRDPFVERLPSDVLPGVEPLRLETSDGEELGAWFAPGDGTGPAVVLLHGNGDSRAGSVGRGAVFLDAGAAVLAPTLRAHGDSTGERNDLGYSARHDVVAAVEALEARCPGRPVVVLGFSLGAAAATFASGALGRRVSGYVLEAPYRDLHHAVRARTREFLPPLLDRVAYAGLVVAATVVLPEADQISPERAIAGVPEGTPVLIMTGGADRRAPPEDARAILAAVRGHGRLEVFEGASHESLLAVDPGRYRSAIEWLLEQVRDRAGCVGPGATGSGNEHIGE